METPLTDDSVALDPATTASLVELVVKGMSRGEPTAAQRSLVEGGYATDRAGTLMPSQTGVALAGRLRRLTEAEVEERVTTLFHAFLPVNRDLRQLCTDWQMRPEGTPNDHSDPSYDAAVRDRLDDIHARVDRVLRRLADAAPELGHYREELAAALERLDGGDSSALTSPLSASYHNVWMWLHQELLLMLGVSRAEDEKLEAELVAAAET